MVLHHKYGCSVCQAILVPEFIDEAVLAAALQASMKAHTVKMEMATVTAPAGAPEVGGVLAHALEVRRKPATAVAAASTADQGEVTPPPTEDESEEKGEEESLSQDELVGSEEGEWQAVKYFRTNGQAYSPPGDHNDIRPSVP